MRMIASCLTFILVPGLGCSQSDTTISSPPDPAQSESTTTSPDIPSKANAAETSSADSTESHINSEIKGTIVEQIQGRWVITEASMSGQPMDTMKGAVAEIVGNEITIEAGGQKAKSTMKFYEGSNPVQFDAINEAGQAAKAILELKDGELIVNTSLTGEAFPESFAPGPGLMLVKYRQQ